MRERQLHLFGVDDDRKIRKRRYVVGMPLDTLILMVVIMVLLLTIAFSMGVEKGRKIARNAVERQQPLLQSVSPEPVAAVREDQEQDGEGAEVKAERADASGAVFSPEPAARQGDKTVPVSVDEKYIIQVASYIKEDIAYQEAGKLEEKEICEEYDSHVVIRKLLIEKGSKYDCIKDKRYRERVIQNTVDKQLDLIFDPLEITAGTDWDYEEIKKNYKEKFTAHVIETLKSCRPLDEDGCSLDQRYYSLACGPGKICL